MAALCTHVQQEHEPSHSGIQTITFCNMEEVHNYTLLTLSTVVSVTCTVANLFPVTACERKMEWSGPKIE